MSLIEPVEKEKTIRAASGSKAISDLKREVCCPSETSNNCDAPTTTTSTGLLDGDWIDRARSVAPVIAAWRDTGEQERHMPQPLFEVLRDAGLFTLIAPPALGDVEAEHEIVLRAIEELSSQDGSVGWNVMIASHMAVIASYLPQKGAREIYRSGARTVIAGA